MFKKICSVIGLSLIISLISKRRAHGDWSPFDFDSFGLPNASLYDIITNILDWLVTIVGVVGVIAFIIAGILYLTSAGDDDQIKRAKKAMVNSIIGVIVAIMGVIVLVAVDKILNADSF